MSQMAMAADYYQMPTFGYIEHYRTVRERYGNGAAKFDLALALELRDLKLQRAAEAIEKAQ